MGSVEQNPWEGVSKECLWLRLYRELGPKNLEMKTLDGGGVGRVKKMTCRTAFKPTEG